MKAEVKQELKLKMEEVVNSLDEFLQYLSNTFEAELSTNSVSANNDVYDYIQVRFFGNPPDGDEQERIAKEFEGVELITLTDAIEEYNVRINNTLDAIGHDKKI